MGRFRTSEPNRLTLPTISNVVSDQVTAEGAHFSALVAPNWGETIYGFEYGETMAYGRQVLGDDVLEADGLATPSSLDVDGLTAWLRLPLPRPGSQLRRRLLRAGPDIHHAGRSRSDLSDRHGARQHEREAERPCLPAP